MSRKFTTITTKFLALAVGILLGICTNSVDGNQIFEQRRLNQSNHHNNNQETKDANETYFREQGLRVVTFGSSRAWGAGLRDPSKESFTALLGGDNKAIRASNADYPAMCTYSMIGETDIYDVILIEYLPQSYMETSASLLALGARLRQRFPDAVIIYINMWTNHQFIHLKEKKGLREVVMAKAKEEGTGLQDGILSRVIQFTQNKDLLFLGSEGEWLKETVTKDPKIQAQVIHYDLPSKNGHKHGGYLHAIMELQKYYLPDMTHFNPHGHEWIKDQVTALLKELQHTRSDRVNPWESKDRCQSWFQSGEIDLETNMQRTCFSDCTKFALESSTTTDAMDYLELINDSGRPQHLYLSHMSSGPNDIYGGATATIINGDTKYSVPIDTFAWQSTYEINVMKHTYLGMIEEGDALVQLEQKGVGMKPFLTTGIIMTPDTFGTEKLQADLS